MRSMRSSLCVDLTISLTLPPCKGLLHPLRQHILNPIQPRRHFIQNLILDILVPIGERTHKRLFVGTFLFQSLTSCADGFFACTSRFFTTASITCLSRPFDPLGHDSGNLLW